MKPPDAAGPRRFEAGTAGRLGAEMLGTFVLTLVAAGADGVDALTHGTLGHASRYLAPGFIVTALIWSFSGVSGAHINPAVTLAFVVRGVFSLGRAAAYWASQLIGATLAGLALVAVLGPSASQGVNHVMAGLSPLAAVATEALLTAILITIVLGTSEQEAVVGKNAAIAVGFTVAACGLVAAPLTGASMNPARSLGPAIATGTWTQWWVYLVGPAIGALAAATLVQGIYGDATYAERKAAHGKQS
jgi:MIP family channel proteins